MERWIWGAILLLGISNALFAQQPWQQQTNYKIDVLLNDAAKTLDGNLTLEYRNASPDTLHFIWFHLWPNAYKNDKTAFAEQQLLNRSTEFYFAQPDQLGYINRLDFKVNEQTAAMEDHPQHFDIAKLKLPSPLMPGESVTISTPFHVQLPYRFSRLGHANGFYSITQWFPKAAVYDTAGWHPMPYLDIGEFFADFGNYKVSITLPANYAVAATGLLQNEEEKQWLKEKKELPIAATTINTTQKYIRGKLNPNYGKESVATPKAGLKTLHFEAEKVVDFAWFAHKDYIVKYDTVHIDHKPVEMWNFVLPQDTATWAESMPITKAALLHYSREVGTYPYPQVSIVGDPLADGSGMEYPMVTSLNSFAGDKQVLEQLIVHEVGHNWFQAILANNERDHPWLDEGFNSYIERKYLHNIKESATQGKKPKYPLLPEDELVLNWLTGKRLDAPIMSTSTDMDILTYASVAYTKTALWLEQIEKMVGQKRMQSAIRQYFKQHQFSHVYPETFLKLLPLSNDTVYASQYETLHAKGFIEDPSEKSLLLSSAFLFGNLNIRQQKVGIFPAIGYNALDKLQVGLLFHNYKVPEKPFQWVAAPMIATGSKQLTGYARGSYTRYPENSNWHKVEAFMGMGRFNTQSRTNAADEKIFGGFTKFVPGIYLERKKPFTQSTLTRWMELKSWIIQERTLGFASPPPPGDTVFFGIQGATITRVIPQLAMGWKNNRILYPYSLTLAAQHVNQIMRFTAEGKYFFNYDASGQGLSIRAFAGKIIYLTNKTDAVRINNSRYHFTMHGPNGIADYTYSQPFIERNQSAELAGRQIMIRDGGFKYRSDFSAVRPGLSNRGLDFFDNWLASLNFEAYIPNRFNPLTALPIKIPLKVFADIGTSASPWRPESEENRFLYSIGIQLPVAKALQIYLPLLQSQVFKEPNSVNDPNRPGGANWWQRKITFTLDLEQLKPDILGIKLIR